MLRRRTVLLAALLAAIGQVGCESSPTEPGEDTPRWLVNLIGQIAAEPVTNPPTEIWRYRYRGDVVYYRTARCCDIQSDLWTESGALICHPGGGISDGVDPRCPDFRHNPSDGRLVWRDPRRG